MPELIKVTMAVQLLFGILVDLFYSLFVYYLVDLFIANGKTSSQQLSVHRQTVSSLTVVICTLLSSRTCWDKAPIKLFTLGSKLTILKW